MSSVSRLDAIVLAAGAGSRFGGAKLTSPWRGGLLIDGALAAARASPVREVLVVTGADAGVEAAVGGFASKTRTRLVFAPDHALGLSASLRAGLAALPRDCDGAFVFLGDMPCVPHAIAWSLAELLSGDILAAAPTFDGRRGHSVLLSKPLFPALMRGVGDAGAGQVLRGLGGRLALVPTSDPGVVTDVDFPADLENLPPAAGDR